ECRWMMSSRPPANRARGPASSAGIAVRGDRAHGTTRTSGPGMGWIRSGDGEAGRGTDAAVSWARGCALWARARVVTAASTPEEAASVTCRTDVVTTTSDTGGRAARAAAAG